MNAFYMMMILITPYLRLVVKYYWNSEGQETGMIAPAPENACKIIWGAWAIEPVKKIVLNFF
jgi:hypothetical protein